MQFPFVRSPYAFLILAAACGGGSTVVDPPPPPPPSAFSVALKPDAEDLAAAQGLGWANGIPDADVTLTPRDSSAAPRTARSSAFGTVGFGTLTAGTYILETTRWLTAAEVAKLPAGQDVAGWVAKNLMTVTALGGEQEISVPASRRKGLVISEWAFNSAAPPPLNESYHFGGYLEIYNNGDTTAFLDGLTVVEGLVNSRDFQSTPCTALSPFRNDPGGIWTRHVQQFPGSGRDYSLAPGRSAVIAVDAIDHATIIVGGLDLSQAAFEFWGGPGDVDNPGVPNMIDTLSVGYDLTGHGPVFAGLGSVLALARPYVLSTVSRSRLPDGPSVPEYARVSAERILDVVTLWPNDDPGVARCPQLINAGFDRRSSDVRRYDWELEYEFSISRRSVPTSLSSYVLLQHSRDSDADFVRTRRSPAIVP